MKLTDTTKSSCNLDSLKTFLDENQIKSEIFEDSRFFGEVPYKYIEFDFPVARSKETIRVYDNENIESILTCDFLKYRGISKYEAIWSSDLKTIECSVEDAIGFSFSRSIIRRLSKLFPIEETVKTEYDGDEPSKLLLFSNDSIQIYLGYSSKEFAVLSSRKDGRRIDIDGSITHFRATLQIKNVVVNTEDEARRILEKISNTLFYQMDVLYDCCMSLSPRRESLREQKRKKQYKTKDIEIQDLTLKFEYDEIPLSLYWFAQSNTHSPIFMYFALYQALEYYYPIYASRNAKERIQILLKKPDFRSTRDSDIMKILDIVKSNNSSAWGDELGQLKITLKSILLPNEVVEFIKANTEINEYFSSKNSTKIAERKLRLEDLTGIMDDLAERIYDIRCRIVHNKASETDKKILPMTQNVEYLKNDVELLKFIVRRVIIANSRDFSLL